MSKASELPQWSAGVVSSVANVLGDTGNGLTGTEIGDLLRAAGIPDPEVGSSKRARLTAALQHVQDRDGHPGRLVIFVRKAMDPARYVRAKDAFAWRQDQLNEVLSFEGLRVLDDGRIAKGSAATTLTEAAQHAHALRAELERRSTHPRVLAACSVELLADNAFHALLEAVKGVFDRLRELSGQAGDGAPLVDATLATGRTGEPALAINALVTDSDRSEQAGFANLLKGMGSLYRNPVAHDPRARRRVSDEELLEALTVVSLAHRRLDSATRRR